MRINWKARAIAAESMVNLMTTAPVLTNIASDGRLVRFSFMRGGVATVIECMGTWDDDVDGWRKALLGPMGVGEHGN